MTTPGPELRVPRLAEKIREPSQVTSHAPMEQTRAKGLISKSHQAPREADRGHSKRSLTRQWKCPRNKGCVVLQQRKQRDERGDDLESISYSVKPWQYWVWSHRGHRQRNGHTNRSNDLSPTSLASKGQGGDSARRPMTPSPPFPNPTAWKVQRISFTLHQTHLVGKAHPKSPLAQLCVNVKLFCCRIITL